MRTTAGHAAAVAASSNYLERVGDSMDVQVAREDGSDVFWRAAIEAEHPIAPDVEVRVSACGSSRDGALELARLELQGLAYRCALDGAAAARVANQQREAHVYAPGERGNARVRAALQIHGARATPIDAEVEAAALSIRVRDGKREVLVGDVVAEVLNRQAFPINDADGQGTIAV